MDKTKTIEGIHILRDDNHKQLKDNQDYNMKLELGSELKSIPTPFMPKPLAEELALCQRYYEKISFHSNIAD